MFNKTLTAIRKLINDVKTRPLTDNVDVDLRPYFSKKYVNGYGIEIGALHKPVEVKNAVVKYVDYKTKEENIKRYPELSKETIVKTDIIDDGFILRKIKDNSLDFIIANHFLEHSPDPIGTIENLRVKLRKNGILFLAVPICSRCYDLGRPLTTYQHLVDDYEVFKDASKNFSKFIEKAKEHLIEFYSTSDRNIRKEIGLKPQFSNLDEIKITAEKFLIPFQNEIKKIAEKYSKTAIIDSAKLSNEIMEAHVNKINFEYDIHYHTFSPESYRQFFISLENLKKKVKLIDIAISGKGEVIAIAKNISS